MFLALIGTLIFSCEKDSLESTNGNPAVGQPELKASDISKSGLRQDSLTISLTNLGNYLNQQDGIHNGDLFRYMNNKPNFTFIELENLGYLQESEVRNAFDNIVDEVSTRTDSEIFDVITYVGSTPGFSATVGISGDDGTLVISNKWNPKGFTLFRWKGILTKDLNCFQLLFWGWGNGC